MSTSRPQNPTQISNNLPGVTHHITGHDAATGKAVIHSTSEGTWTSFLGNSFAMSVVYTTSEFPVSLNDDKDIVKHDEVISSKKLGLVNSNGTVCRLVDFKPESDPMMHRTQSLDYGVVLEGSIELVLDSGEVKLLQRGDVAVQRATMHGWRNPSKTEWARMLFVLQDCQELVVGGKPLREDLGAGTDKLSSSA